MSRANKWIPLDKYLAQELPKINRLFSKIEAMYAYTLDQDNGKEGTINGYAKQWGWSRNKVRDFIKSIRTDYGHIKDTTRTHYGHPIHFIDKGLWVIKDTLRTDYGHIKDTLKDTTTNPNPNPKETTQGKPAKKKGKKEPPKYSEKFLHFWSLYPNKQVKIKAFEAWQEYDCDNGIYDKILQSLERQLVSDQWTKDKGKYIPMGSTWVKQMRWEDEGTGSPQSVDCTKCGHRKDGLCEKTDPNCKSFQGVR